MSIKANTSAIVKPTEKELARLYNVRKDFNFQKLFIVIGLLLFALALWLTRAYSNIDLKDGIESFVAVAVAVIAYSQWRDARHEISIDKYYDRLDNANNRLEKLKDVDIVALHVFAEMDKLEYVIMKYKIGFIPVGLVFRAIENFKSLCMYRDNFHGCAAKYIPTTAYLPKTRELVIRILDENLPCSNATASLADKENKV